MFDVQAGEEKKKETISSVLFHRIRNIIRILSKFEISTFAWIFFFPRFDKFKTFDYFFDNFPSLFSFVKNSLQNGGN